DYVISRMATCDADNLCDYQSVLTSTHTNCLIRFVKERLVKSVWLRAFRLNRGAHSTLSSFAVKRLF
ncbi:hypothetical protein ACI2OW_18800, partial [Pseudomonas shirazica]